MPLKGANSEPVADRSAARVVFVTRETDYELLLARHATREQARFFLETRGQRIEEVEARHEALRDGAARRLAGSVPADWRQALVRRADLDRFLFGPEDVVVAVGQDGLVANVAKYLDGPAGARRQSGAGSHDGVLVRIGAARLARLLAARSRATRASRADDGRGRPRRRRNAARAQ